MSSVTIPTGVGYIGASAFNCSTLTSVTVKWNTPLALSAAAFPNSQNATLYVPLGCKNAYKAANYWKDFKQVKEFSDTPIDLATATVQATYAESLLTYTGYQVRPTVTGLKINNITMSDVDDFYFDYGENINADEGTVIVTAKESGVFVNAATVSFTIGRRNINYAAIASIADQTYTGAPLTPAVSVTDGNPSVITPDDYDVTYSNNVQIGKGAVTLTGKRNYMGAKTAVFSIVPIDGNDAVVTLAAHADYVFDSLEKRPAVASVRVGDMAVANTNYDVSYSDNVNAGEGVATVTFKNNYTGTARATFTIQPRDIATVSVSAIADQVYTGEAIEPSVTVTDGNPNLISAEDYDVSYTDNTDAGDAFVTLAGKRNYAGVKVIGFSILPADATGAEVTLGAPDSYVYTGVTKEPAVLSVKKGEAYISAANYDVAYTDNVSVGDALVTLTFKNNYKGTASASFSIEKAPLTIAARTYTKKQGEAMPDFTLTYTGFVNNETKAVLTCQPEVSCAADETSAPGEYAVTVSGAEAANYEISYVTGKLVVTPADPVTVTAKSYTREYGEENPAFEFTSSGAALNGTPSVSCAATASSPVGTYDIVITKGSVENYNDHYVNGTLTITKAPLTVTAGSYSREAGEENPAFELIYQGWKLDENESVLTAKPVASTVATADSPAGEYAITVDGGEAQNYSFTYVNGVLTVKPSTGIIAIGAEGQPFNVYTTTGYEVRHQVTTLAGLPKGIYVVNGRKVVVK